MLRKQLLFRTLLDLQHFNFRLQSLDFLGAHCELATVWSALGYVVTHVPSQGVSWDYHWLLEFYVILNEQFPATSQLPRQLINLLSQLSNLSWIGVSINNGLILNIPRSACIFQGVQGLLKVNFGRGNTSDHWSARIASQGVLKDSSELAVTVGNMHLLSFLCQCGYHITQG